MSAEEQVAIARLGQQFEDFAAEMREFTHEMKAWKQEVDTERNKVKGAIVTVGVLGGAIGGLLGWIGRNIRISL